MALKRLGLTDLISAIQNKVNQGTGRKCYDHVEDNTASPFYFAEVVQQIPENTKTMFRDKYQVWIHCIAAPEDNGSSVGVYQLIQDLEEAMTEDVALPEGFELIMQTYNGVQSIYNEETHEKHAVCAFEFMVCYGFKCKI